MKKYTRLLLVPVILGALAAECQTVHSPTDDVLAQLLPLLSPAASIVLPNENATLFFDLTRRYTQRFEPEIAVVVRVGTESDVSLIVDYASKSGRAIVTGSGRHGLCVSMNNVYDAILIDITQLSTIVIDAAANTMTVGGGVTIGGVMAAVRAAGKEATAGACDCVGYLGASLGGGHGRLQGLHGLMADNIISAHVVTGNGEMIEVSDSSNPDLFWGLKGAGHNFGIVTEAVYRIYDETNGGLQFNAEITYASVQLEALFAAIEGFAQPAETSMFVLFVPGPDMKPIIALSFTSYSPEESGRSQLDSVFGHLPHLTRAESMVPSDQMNTVGALGVGAAACDSHHHKNYFSASLTHYDIPTVRTIYTSYAAFLTSAPNATGSIVLWETYSMHGVQAVPADNTAYPHREERHIVMLLAGYLDTTLQTPAEKWLRNATALLHRNSGYERPTVYLNYAQGDEGVGAMYGYESWRLDRLAELKRKYDPWGVFNAYHPIPSE